jgi:hypothetical protein
MVATSIHASVRSLPLTLPPPAYNVRNTVPTSTPTSRGPHINPLKITIWISVLSLILSLIAVVILMNTGTKERDWSSGGVRFGDYSILTVPITYRNTCIDFYGPDPDCKDKYLWYSEDSNNTCPERLGPHPKCKEYDTTFTFKMYLNAFWGYQDSNLGTQQSYYYGSSSQVLGKGIGQAFDLADVLRFIDSELAYLRALREDYEVPDPALRSPTQFALPPPLFQLKRMTPIATMAPFVLLVVGMVAALPILLTWLGERRESTKQKNVKLMKRRWMFLIFGVMFLCWLTAAAYIAAAARQAVSQLNLNVMSINTPGIKASFGGKFQALLAGAIICQVVSMTSYGAHCWIEKQITERRAERERRVREAEGEAIEEEEPPAYAVEMTDLARTRATEEQDSERHQRGGTEV